MPRTLSKRTARLILFETFKLFQKRPCTISVQGRKGKLTTSTLALLVNHILDGAIELLMLDTKLRDS